MTVIYMNLDFRGLSQGWYDFGVSIGKIECSLSASERLKTCLEEEFALMV
jgi:hypothetical protein